MTSETAWHALSPQHVFELLAADASGLSAEEAAQRLALHGPNTLPSAPRPSVLWRFLHQFNNLLIGVLLVAAFITGLMQHWSNTLVILAVVMVNAMIGFIQENKAEHAMEAIQKLLSLRANVLRNGMPHMIPAAELVPGDIVLLAAGDKVPADLRLLHGENVQAQEAVLTGESFSVTKNRAAVAENAPLGDRSSMLYGGTLITHGTAKAVVTATGAATEMGRIGQMMQAVSAPPTPLIQKINRFARWLTGVILALSLTVFLYGLLIRHVPVSEMFMTVVGIAVAAIPEGLPAVISITLALGVASMAKHNAIVRHLPAIESLGSVNIICTDKTGTLTKNELAVSDIISAEHAFHVSGAGYAPEGNILFEEEAVELSEYSVLQAITRAAALNNDARMNLRKGVWEMNGEPTEGALLSCAIKAGHDHDELHRNWPRTAAIPFSAEARMMATLHHNPQGECHLYVKGAPENILAACETELWHDGTARPIRRSYWEDQIDALGTQGKRVLAVAQSRPPAHKRVLSAADMQGLVLLGLFGIMDVPREEVPEAIATCHQAGITVKMITGDHVLTAAAIGKSLGISDDGRVITGSDMEHMSETALAKCAKDIHIFARMQPAQKLKLVHALQADGLVVAMTGDGVNDAPALKAADIGIAMGKGGTEAAKEASQIVLADDLFVSIVHAVEEGRSVYAKLRRTIQFMLTTDVSEAMVLVFGLFGGLALAITPLQILWVNTATAITISLAFAFTRVECGVMKRQPLPVRMPLFSPGAIVNMLVTGTLMTTAVLFAFQQKTAEGFSVEHARTFAVNLLVAFEVAYLLALYPFRQQQHGTLRAAFPACVSIVLIIFLQLAFTYGSWLQALFATEPLGLSEWVEIGKFSGALLVTVLLMQRIGRYSQEKVIKLRASQPKGAGSVGAGASPSSGR